eukprot:gene3068-4818_t
MANTGGGNSNAGFQLPDDRVELVYMAKLCEQAERYEEMALCLRKVIKMHPDLTTEERNLVSMAYKMLISPKRLSWRIVAGAEDREEIKGNAKETRLIGGLRKTVEKEIEDICDELFSLLESHLIPNAKGPEEQVFYLKSKADYHRYYTEISSTPFHKDAASDSYHRAQDIAARSLPHTHPIRLGLALNFAVFAYEIGKNGQQAVEIAQKAFDNAVSELESLDDESYAESKAIVQ